jgi:hypothetical protein
MGNLDGLCASRPGWYPHLTNGTAVRNFDLWAHKMCTPGLRVLSVLHTRVCHRVVRTSMKDAAPWACELGSMSVLPENYRSRWRPSGMAFLFLCLVIGLASRGKASPVPPKSAPAHSALAASQYAIADFDGDSRPDLATVQVGQSGSSDTRYWILFRLSTGMRQTVGVTAPAGGLRISSRDVNGDSFLDVIVTTAWTNRPVAVLLNDGRGNFTRSDPSAFQEAFWTSDTSWASTTDEIKDAAAILLPRHPSGDCEEKSGPSSPQSASRLLAAFAIYPPLLSQAVSFLGRAPPSLL